uniref:Uncharacterized protein n=1 Tax=Solanum tuberosum TaxID=4113 RepID=M1DQH4_SOLTU
MARQSAPSMGHSTFSLSRKRRSTSTDRQSTHGLSVNSIDGPVNFQSSVANDGRPVRTVSRLTACQSTPSMGQSTFSLQSRTTVDQFRFSASRSPLDRFPISSSVESVYAHDHASRVSLGSLVVLGPVSATRGQLGA